VFRVRVRLGVGFHGRRKPPHSGIV
jgi:hypothetical protein